MDHNPRQPARPGSRAGASALSTLLAAGLAHGAVDPEALRIDQELQVLKGETIQLNRDLQMIEQAMLYPDQSAATIYVAVKVAGFLLDEITVRINENEPVAHTYTESEALAFLKSEGWQRLLRLKLEPGSYRLRAEFRGHFYDAKPNDAPVTGKVETLFEKGISELDLVLPISRNTRLDKPGLSEISRLESRRLRPTRNVWLPQPQRFESVLTDAMIGTLNDPRYRSALFLKHDGRFLSALTELLEIARTAPDRDALPGAFHLLLAECYLGFGMEAQAELIYLQISGGKHDATTLARAQLELARFEYQRGYYRLAFERLDRLGASVPSALLDDWRQLLTATLLAQERYAEAIALLTRGDRVDELLPVLRYNLAVAYMRDGRTGDARRQLNQVGTMDVSNLEMLVLRDKANLTLGYNYLQSQQGHNARNVFGRIRTSGPFSNRALLGLGWAEVAPPEPKGEASEEAEGKNTADSLGTLLRPGYVDPKARERLAVAPGAGVLSAAEQDGLVRALVPWVELVKRDPMDPAVQEGMLAIPWALDRLQSYEQSLARYNEAIATLETARSRMNEAIKSIKGGRMVETIVRRDTDSERGWMWRLRDLPDAPETYFLQSLLAEHRFQESLKNYRDGRLLARNLDAWKTRIAQLQRPGGAARGPVQRFARAEAQPAWAGTVIWLALATELGAPGAWDAPLSDAPDTPLGLATLAPPTNFAGRLEQLRPLATRLDGLKPRIAAATGAQGKLLETISLRELEGQRQTIERYLTEARFAVARIYDRRLQGGRP